MRTHIVAVSLVAGLCVGRTDLLSAADEWPQFRGPDANGHSTATGLPLTWSETEHVRWKVTIPGDGHSSPVISGDQIWLTTAVPVELSKEEQKLRLSKLKNPGGLKIVGGLSLQAMCVNRESGKVERSIEVIAVDKPEPVHSLNSYASPTPVIEQGRLYCHFGAYGTACLDVESGKVLWTNTEHHVDHQNGPGASPALWNNVLILNFDGIDTQYVAALDKQSGETAWTTKRSGAMPEKAEFRKTYSTPAVVEHDGRPQVVIPGADWVYAYDPATGDEIWKAAYGMLGFSTVPRPIFGHGMTFISTSFMRPRLLAVRYDGTGDVTDTHIAWHIDGQLPRKTSMLLIGDELTFISDNGIATCLDARTGSEHWKERIEGNYSASPLFADGRLYFFSQEGKATVVNPGTDYGHMAENSLDGGFMASPAVAGKAIYLRTETHLYRIEND